MPKGNHPETYFSPDSVIWRVNRERILLLGGARALLMQIAHPLVAEAVYEHSAVFEQPIRRLRRTLDLTLALVFGTKAEVHEAARAINHSHRRVNGQLGEATGAYAEGVRYDAFNPELLLWVYATLVEGAVSGYERFVGPLTAAEKEAYYEESKQIAGLLRLDDAQLPPSLDALCDYMDDMIASGQVVVGPRARAIAPHILVQTSPILKAVGFPAARMTAGLLPPPLREQYGFGFSPLEEKALDAFCRSLRYSVPLLPPLMRHVPQARRL